MAKKKKSSFQKVRVGYGRAWRRPTVKLVHLIVFAAVFMWLGHYLFPSNALTTYPYEKPAMATDDFNRVATYRSNHGWRTLNRASCLDTIASNWAKKEAAQNAIQDPSATWMSNQLATYCSSHYWLAWGANDGFSNGLPGTAGESNIFTSFLGSCEHLQNIADHGTAGNTINIGACTDRYKVYHSSYNVRASAFNQIGVGAWVGSVSGGTLYIAQIYARW